MITFFNRFAICVSVFAFWVLSSVPAAVAGSDPPNWQPDLRIVVQSAQSKAVTHNIGPRTQPIEVPAGSKLTLELRASNIGGNPGSDGVSMDVWLDWPTRAWPGDEDDADYVCIPESQADCLDWTRTISADLGFAGKQGKGVYNVVVWVDRFDTVSEDDETNNVLGPVTIRVLPTIRQEAVSLGVKPGLLSPAHLPDDKTRTENRAIEEENKTIERMKKEAKELEAELEELEQGGGG